MNILIVEDEDIVAKRLERLSKEILGCELGRLKVFHTLDDARDYLSEHSIDLLFLDLNLAGQDGFALLKLVVANAFHTIVVSANIERAIEAFEYGVLDFVGKPFTRGRLEKALARYQSNFRQQQTKYISIKRQGVVEAVGVDEILYFRGANIYSDVVLQDGSTPLHDKPLSRLEQLLPEQFQRVHKSYIVNTNAVKGYNQQGNNAELVMNNGESIPVSRTKMAEVKAMYI